MRLKNPSKEHHTAEVKLAEVEAQKKRLKNLIVLGKERGYLTYAEINDHLPDDMTDAEQIEGVVTMLADMGIAVYDEAPDAEQLLMNEAPTPIAEEDVIEEAEEALSTTIDSEFGRTTDPVRMYMREMGSVELLTREGEIEIAKRIEDGLKHMIHAISSCPTTIEEILRLAELVEKVENLSNGLRHLVERVRSHEREIMELCTRNANMPRQHFIKVFPGNETNMKWAGEEVTSGRVYAKALERFRPAIMEQQEALINLQ